MMSSVPSAASGSSRGAKARQEELFSPAENPGVSDGPPLSPEAPEHTQDSKLIKKKGELKLQIESLQTQIGKAQAELGAANGKLGGIDASTRVQKHIKLLHQYNEIKDIGTGLFGVIAEHRGVQVKDVFEEFGIGEGD